MKRTLTQPENDALYTFTHKKGVKHYDIQVELVDHLGSAIEDQWEQDPELPFETALQRVYKGFGIFGFEELQETKVAAIRKGFQRRWWQTFLQVFSWPLLLGSLLLFGGMHFLFSSFDPHLVRHLLTGILAGSGLVYGFAEIRFHRKHLRKKLALMGYGWSFAALIYWPVYINFYILRHYAVQHVLVLAATFTVLTLFLVAFVQASQGIKAQARQHYPAAFAG